MCVTEEIEAAAYEDIDSFNDFICSYTYFILRVVMAEINSGKQKIDVY